MGRKPLSDKEDTVAYRIRVIKSTKRELMRAGASRVRRLLDTFAQMAKGAQDDNQVDD